VSVAFTLGLLVAVASCSSDELGASEEIPDVGVVHVHGLGVDPGNGTLYAATHSGLFRIDGPDVAERVGEHWHDLMGFTVVGPNRFLASGHPDLRTDLPPLLGLVESDDAGRTWTSRSLLGETDFHALEAVGGRIYAYDGTSGRFMVSSDGQRWTTRSRIASILDIAVSPTDPTRVLATTEGGVLGSADGGKTWEPIAAAPQASFVAWDEQQAWLVAPDGTVSSSVNAGRTWRAVGTLGVSSAPEAFTVADGVLYVATSGSGILRSSDGTTWDVVYRA
jgi:hypothetical protein